MSYKDRQRIKKNAKYKARQEAKSSREFQDKVLIEMFPITLSAVKFVFKERASNIKCEQVAERMLSLMEQIGTGKLSLKTLIESVEMETGILCDAQTREVINTKRKG